MNLCAHRYRSTAQGIGDVSHFFLVLLVLQSTWGNLLYLVLLGFYTTAEKLCPGTEQFLLWLELTSAKKCLQARLRTVGREGD